MPSKKQEQHSQPEPPTEASPGTSLQPSRRTKQALLLEMVGREGGAGSEAPAPIQVPARRWRAFVSSCDAPSGLLPMQPLCLLEVDRDTVAWEPGSAWNFVWKPASSDRRAFRTS